MMEFTSLFTAYRGQLPITKYTLQDLFERLKTGDDNG